MHKKILFILIIIIFSFYNYSFANIEKTNEVFIPEGYEGVYIIIYKSYNIMRIYLNDYVIYSFPVATGKNKLLTPEGYFEIITKIKNPWYLPKNIPGGDTKNPLGTRWLGINVPNTGGYTYGIHGTNNPYSIGNYVSQGCIRMYNKHIEWLYDHIPLHTPVIITN